MSNLNCASCGKSISLAQRYLSHDSRPMCSICYTEPQQNFDVRRIYLRPSAGAAEQLFALVEHPTIAELELKVAQAKIASLNAYVKELETVLEIYKGIVAEQAGDKP